jgi:glycosyltransferase involved in cell wall biosynthesis
MSRLRVAIVAPSLGILGGQSIQADLLIRAWQEDPDVGAFLVPIDPPFPAPIRWARRVKYVRTIANECTYGPRLLRDLRRADVVHIFSASYSSFLLAPLPAVAAARLLGKPVIFNYHSGQAPDHLARSGAARKLLARVDRIAVPSDFLVRVFRHFGLNAQSIPNIVDLRRFSYRERPGVGPRILSTRTFESLYNVACTLQAFRLVQHRHPDASLTLAGGGSGEAALRHLAAALDLRHVTFAGRVPPDRMADVFAAHDIYLQSPNIDNMPLSILEAFASGLPVVTTDAGGIVDMVSHRSNGLLASTNDHEALAAHVLELLDNPSFALTLARTAVRGIDCFQWRAVRPQWLGVYRNVLETGASSRMPVLSRTQAAAEVDRGGRP